MAGMMDKSAASQPTLNISSETEGGGQGAEWSSKQ